ncbi:MAG: phosphate ABC transporter, permease protein PstA [Deltaproteobacteria bacterium]|nr:phosphate ABC transporter, permease protein PstA [Deltaproteobacteria bacterium]
MSSSPSNDAATRAAEGRIQERYRTERLFQAAGVAAIGFALFALLALLVSITYQSSSALSHTYVELEVELDADTVDPRGDGSPESLAAGGYSRPLRNALRARFPEVSGRKNKRRLNALLSDGAEYQLRDAVLADPGLVGQTASFVLPMSDDVDLLLKGDIDRNVAESDRKLTDLQIEWVDALVADGAVSHEWNTGFLTNGDSREPELAGMQGAIRGSLLTLLVTLLLSFPVGVAAAVYLEEFAPRNRFTDLVEVNINNLAAVPSIIFGLLGLAVFLNVFGMPRGAPIVGGIVLALMTLPTIIIAGRAALLAVPPSIREAALGVGASPTQAVLHHVLPQALPGILTGTIIGMARALGETAPLLMIGMVAFIADLPSGLSDPSTVLPVQIFLWNDAPERAFVARTSLGIVVLLGFLVAMNAAAVWVRSRFETRY